MSFWPYVNFGDLNLDWILGVVKDFQDKYENIDRALSNAITSINQKTNTSMTVLEAEKNQILNAIIAAREGAVSEINTEATAALARITALVEDLPDDTEALLTDLEYVKTVLTEINTVIGGEPATPVPYAQGSEGKSINANTGAEVTSATYNNTDYIDISPYVAITYTKLGITGTSITAGIAFYDADKAYISGVVGLKQQATSGYVIDTSLIPPGAKYMRATMFADTAERGFLAIFGFSYISTDSAANLEELSKITLPPVLIAQGGITGTNGNNTTGDNRVRTPRQVHKSVRRVVCETGYSVAAFAYDTTAQNEYKGRILDGGDISKFSDSSHALGWFASLDLWALKTLWPNYIWRLVFRKNDDAEITPVTLAPHVTYYYDTEQGSGVIYPTIRIPETTADVYTLYDVFVAAGIASRTSIATVQGLPIYKYTFSAVNGYMDGSDYDIIDGQSIYPKRKILLTSGMHGDEKSAVTGLYEFLVNVVDNPEFSTLLTMADFVVIPVCNPTGYNADSRLNYQGKNINRLDTDTEEGGGNTVEAISIKAVIDSGKWDLYIDSHNMRTDTASQNTSTAAGAMSFAYGMPEADKDKCYALFTNATAKTTQTIIDELSKDENNGKQAFFPWNGQNVNSFRQYAYTHEYNGQEVGAPISATCEASRRCYSLTDNNVDFNGYAILVADNMFIDVIKAFTEMVYDEKESISPTPMPSGFNPEINNPQDGQAIVYDGTANKWKNGDVGGGGGPILAHLDLTTGTLDVTWQQIHDAGCAYFLLAYEQGRPDDLYILMATKIYIQNGAYVVQFYNWELSEQIFFTASTPNGTLTAE